MGGAFAVPGTITPTAEFNFFMDPAAAQRVLDSGVRPILVGLDVCHRARMSAVAAFKTAFGRFVQRACADWLPALDEPGPYLYDSLAVAAALRPGVLELEPALVRIRTDGASAWSRAPGADNALVATGVDVAAFEARFAERVLSLL